ncbi:MAG: TIGR03915 family putative DNA repair protein [Acetivibrionales bacterium]|jgi:probable DNA metabolism protein
MTVYIYDGSFEGILTAVFEAFSRKEAPCAILPENNLQQDFLVSYVFIRTDPAKSERVCKAVPDKISGESLENIYHVFLSEHPDAATLIYKYLKLGFAMGGKVDMHLADNTVFKVMDICRKLELELHRMMGFVRFRQVEGGIFYSPIAPDNNIVELLAPHFAERLPGQNWIIHDVKREIAALYNTEKWIISEFCTGDIPKATQDEKQYAALWKKLFETLEIPDRKNPQLQRRLLPRRYWDYLTEKW